MNKIEQKLVEMEDRIMNFQKKNGFNTIFDFLNEDIEVIRQEVKLNLPVVIWQSEQLNEKDIVMFQNYVEYKYLQEGDEYFNKTTLKTENLKQVIAKFNRRKN